MNILSKLLIWKNVKSRSVFQSDLRDPRCWHNSYMIMRIDFMKKKFQNFFLIFFNFFQFFGHPSDTKRFFCTFGQNITYFYVLRRQHVHLTPKKCFLETHFTKCPWNDTQSRSQFWQLLRTLFSLKKSIKYHWNRLKKSFFWHMASVRNI